MENVWLNDVLKSTSVASRLAISDTMKNSAPLLCGKHLVTQAKFSLYFIALHSRRLSLLLRVVGWLDINTSTSIGLGQASTRKTQHNGILKRIQ